MQCSGRRLASVQGSFEEVDGMSHEPQFAKHRHVRLFGETAMFEVFDGCRANRHADVVVRPFVFQMILQPMPRASLMTN